MSYEEKERKLNRLIEWLNKGRAGSPEALAESFDLSERTIRRWIDDLRKYENMNIVYCRKTKKYRVIKDGDDDG
jgi:predicted DNA-binding transcriptional regulator YafY